MKSLITLGLTLGLCLGFYTEQDDVLTLDTDNFEPLVINSDAVWIVEFYAPWCGHCKSLTPEWKKAASALKGIVSLGAVDMTEHEAVGRPYDVQGFPTILAFGADKATPVPYEGERDAKGIAKFGLGQAKEVVRSRLGYSKEAKSTKPKAKSAVVEITSEEAFKTEVMEAEELVLVEFYAPWCGHCKNLAPHWKKAAAELQGKGVKLVAVDATVNEELAKQFKVTGYPTIKYFPKGEKGEAKDWEGGRTKEAIVEDALQLLEGPDTSPTAVEVLDQSNFDEKVLASDELWIVEFFAPWCGHCKQLAPEWKKASLELEGRVNLATVDCTKETQLCEKYKIEGFPSIKSFSNDKEAPVDYDGGRLASSIVASALALYEVHRAEPRPVRQLTDSTVLEEECSSSTLCFIAFLPHILDTGAAGREQYLDMLREQAMKHKAEKYGFVWAEAVTQAQLEQTLEVGSSGYPALSVVNMKKMVTIPFFGGFSTQGVGGFVKDVAAGKAKGPFKIGSLPSLATVESWDGKDGEAPKEEL